MILREKWSGGHYSAVLYSDRLPRGGRRGGPGVPVLPWQQYMNDRTSRDKLASLLEENFSLSDLFVTLSYDEAHLPPNYDAAAKLLKSFIRCFREMRKANGNPYDYIYVIEGEHGDHRIHHHIIVPAEAGTRELLQALWKFGGIDVETIREFAEKPSARGPALSLQDCVAKYGGDPVRGWGEFEIQAFHKLANYITKEPRKTGRFRVGARMYTPSQSLRKPIIRRSCVGSLREIPLPPGIVELDAERRDNAMGAFRYVSGWVKNRTLQS